MGEGTQVTIGFIVFIIGAVATIYGIYTTNKKNIQQEIETISNIKQENTKEIHNIKQENTKLLSDIRDSLSTINNKQDYQCIQLSDLQADVKSTKAEMSKMKETQILQGAEIKAIWRNIDDIKSRGED